MNIEIQEPQLETLIAERMATGRFKSVEDLLKQTFDAVPENGEHSPPVPQKQSFASFVKDSPLWKAGLCVERPKDPPRPVNL